MKKLLKIVLVLGVILGISGAGAAWWLRAGQQESDAGYRYAQLETSELVATIGATGTIQPEEVIDVGAQVAAQIRNFGVDPRDANKSIDYGSLVQVGTLLAQLDDSLFKARVEQAEASVEESRAQVNQAQANIERADADLMQLEAKQEQAERDFARAQTLKMSRAIADAEYDAALAAVEMARANVNVGKAALLQVKAAKIQMEKSMGRTAASLREAEVNLGYTQIRSPVEGVIIDRRVNVGQTVVAGLNAPSLFLLAKDLKRLQVWASVNEADIGSILPGQPVRFSVDAFPKETFLGQVAQIRLNATMTQNVVTYTVVVTTDNADGKLLPYMTANLQFEVARRPQALLAPNAALRWKPQPRQIAPDVRAEFTRSGRKLGDQDQGFVWVTEGPFVRPVSVRIGLTDGAMTEIVSCDIETGASIVIGNARKNETGGTAANPFAPKLFGKKG